ncbi:hypothetical protein DL96DRAFT_1499901, partial [Flagelloscypha sp. PMI_526]
MSIFQGIELIRSSLLPDEHISFLEHSELWERLLAETDVSDVEIPSSVHFQIRLDSLPLYVLDVQLNGDTPEITIKGLPRSSQEEWHSRVHELLAEHTESEFLVFNVLTQLLPQLKDELGQEHELATPSIANGIPVPSQIYHVLFTSHHLISPTKRKNLQSWSSSLSLSGFAKVGYPGLIYAQGTQDDIEEFVTDVKAMQWLALRVRFVEPLPFEVDPGSLRNWTEFQKVGEAVEEMKRLGREKFVVEMGVGS